jgi:hypothetical protein
VARYTQSTVAVLDPSTCTLSATIDLAAHADGDGVPEMDAITLVDGRVLVSLELLDNNWMPTGNGKVVLIDSSNDTIETVVELPLPYPFGRFRTHGETGETLLALVGTFGAPDGAIVGLGDDLRSPHVIVTEETLGGDVNAFAIEDATHGWAMVATAEGVTLLVPFDPGTGEATEPLIVSTGYDLRDIEIVGDRLLVADGNAEAPGIRAFSFDGEELTDGPQALPLPPAMILAL